MPKLLPKVLPKDSYKQNVMKTYNIKNSNNPLPAVDLDADELSAIFEAYLMSRHYSPVTCRSYAKTLKHERLETYLKRHYHCTTVYELTDIPLLNRFVEKVNVYSENFSSKVRNATMRYIEFLNETEVTDVVKKEEPVLTESGELESIAMNNLFANNDYHVMQDKIHHLESELAIVKSERDEANRMLDEAETKVEEYEKASAVDHDVIVGKVFSEIAQRYMECNKYKDIAGRREVKRTLRDIMDELKMHSFIPKDLQRCISHFDDREPPVIPTINIGTIIMDQHNDNYVGNVENGGTGVSVNCKKKKQ